MTRELRRLYGPLNRIPASEHDGLWQNSAPGPRAAGLLDSTRQLAAVIGGLLRRCARVVCSRAGVAQSDRFVTKDGAKFRNMAEALVDRHTTDVDVCAQPRC